MQIDGKPILIPVAATIDFISVVEVASGLPIVWRPTGKNYLEGVDINAPWIAGDA